jgi:hypothetical protein
MKDVHQTLRKFQRCQSNAWPEGDSYVVDLAVGRSFGELHGAER